jgi:hypothetical protein
MLALFLLFEEITHSTRLAGLGALLYTANGNFLFFNASFKYESLALAFVVISALAVAKWQRLSRQKNRMLWAIVALVAIACTVMTHHISSYLLLGYLVALSVAHRILKKPPRSSPAGFAVFSGAATMLWLLYVAGETRSYVSDIFGRALRGFAETVSSRQGRAPLSEHGVSAPAWEHVAAIAFVLIVTIALPFALLQVWKTYRTNAHVLVLALAASGYLASLTLRLSPAAWETGNRATEFLFLGTALMLALVAVQVVQRSRSHGGLLALLTAAIALVFVGSAIGGQPTDLRLPHPLRVRTGEYVIAPQGYAVADWAAQSLGPRALVIADDSNSRLLAVKGGSGFEYVGGRDWGVSFLLRRRRLYDVSFEIIRQYPVRYVVADRRRLSWDNTRGYYFPPRVRNKEQFLSPLAALKFERLNGIQRLVDTGDIVVFDLGRRRATEH